MRRDQRRQRGSVLILFPVGFLAVLVLAAVAVDASIAFLGERELASAVAAAANDAATEALSNTAFYRRGTVELDAGAVERVAEERVRSSVDSRYRNLQVRATVVRPAGGDCAWALRVEADAVVGYVFARAIPGGPQEAHVDARTIASPRQAAEGC